MITYLTSVPQAPFLVYQKHEKLRRKNIFNLSTAVVAFKTKKNK